MLSCDGLGPVLVRLLINNECLFRKIPNDFVRNTVILIIPINKYKCYQASFSSTWLVGEKLRKVIFINVFLWFVYLVRSSNICCVKTAACQTTLSAAASNTCVPCALIINVWQTVIQCVRVSVSWVEFTKLSKTCSLELFDQLFFGSFLGLLLPGGGLRQGALHLGETQLHDSWSSDDARTACTAVNL